MGENLETVDWHSRYTQQAHWTASLRSYLYERAGLAQARRVLDAGCGTGALEPELTSYSEASITGIDLDRAAISFAAEKGQDIVQVAYAQGNALALPFSHHAFDLCLCHFFLLWVQDPLQAVAEMRRVTRPDGSVLALAEPDYGGRIDYPAELAILGKLQAESLQNQGANPSLGRRLGEIFSAAGLKVIETGVLGGMWREPPSQADWEMEWRVLEADLNGTLSPGQLNELRSLDAAAWQHRERILYVPTFYAWGKA